MDRIDGLECGERLSNVADSNERRAQGPFEEEREKVRNDESSNQKKVTQGAMDQSID